VTTNRALKLLLIAVALQLVGRGVDGWWHATHDEFETAGDQVRAHFVIWVGVLATLVLSALAVRRFSGPARPWYAVVLAASLCYVGVATWHFIEHANHSDPDLPHLLLGVTWGALLAAAAGAAIVSRRMTLA
jgi:hypothetical protein